MKKPSKPLSFTHLIDGSSLGHPESQLGGLAGDLHDVGGQLEDGGALAEVARLPPPDEPDYHAWRFFKIRSKDSQKKVFPRLRDHVS